jgi:hypothetical protein
MSVKEELKIKANFWNGLAIASAVTGVLVPVISAYGDKALWNATVYPPSEQAWRAIWLMLGARFSLRFSEGSLSHARQKSRMIEASVLRLARYFINLGEPDGHARFGD